VSSVIITAQIAAEMDQHETLYTAGLEEKCAKMLVHSGNNQ